MPIAYSPIICVTGILNNIPIAFAIRLKIVIKSVPRKIDFFIRPPLEI